MTNSGGTGGDDKGQNIIGTPSTVASTPITSSNQEDFYTFFTPTSQENFTHNSQNISPTISDTQVIIDGSFPGDKNVLGLLVNDCYHHFKSLITGINKYEERNKFVKIGVDNYINNYCKSINATSDNIQKMKNVLRRLFLRRFRIEVKKDLGPKTEIYQLPNIESQIFGLMQYEPDTDSIRFEDTDISNTLFQTSNDIPTHISNNNLNTKFSKILLYGSLIDGCHDSESTLLLKMNKDNLNINEYFKDYQLSLYEKESFCPKRARQELLELCKKSENILRENGITYTEMKTKFYPKELFKDNDNTGTDITGLQEYNWINEAGRPFGKTAFDTNLAMFDKGSRKLIGGWKENEEYMIDNVYGTTVYIKSLETGKFRVITTYTIGEKIYFKLFEIGNQNGTSGVSLNNAVGLLQRDKIRDFDSAVRNRKDSSIDEDITHIECSQIYCVDKGKFNKDNIFKHYIDPSRKILSESDKNFKFLSIHLNFSLKGAGDASNDLMFIRTIMEQLKGPYPERNAVSSNDNYLIILLRLKYLLGKIDVSPMVALQTCDGAMVTDAKSKTDIDILIKRLRFIMTVYYITNPNAQLDFVSSYYGLDILKKIIKGMTTDEFHSKYVILYLQKSYEIKNNYIKHWISKVNKKIRKIIKKIHKINPNSIDNKEMYKEIIKSDIFENLEYTLSFKDLYEILGEYDEYCLERELPKDLGKYFSSRRGNEYKMFVNDDKIWLKVQNTQQSPLNELHKICKEYNDSVNSDAYDEESKILIYDDHDRGDTYIGLTSSIELLVKLKKIVVKSGDLRIDGVKVKNKGKYFNDLIQERFNKIYDNTNITGRKRLFGNFMREGGKLITHKLKRKYKRTRKIKNKKHKKTQKKRKPYTMKR